MNINNLEDAFSTLLWSWGSEAPPEAIWAANEFMQVLLNDEEIVTLDEDLSNHDEFIKQLKLISK